MILCAVFKLEAARRFLYCVYRPDAKNRPAGEFFFPFPGGNGMLNPQNDAAP